MLQQTSYEPVVYGLSCRGLAKSFDKRFILHKKSIQQLLQIRILHTAHQLQKFLHHIFRLKLADRQILRRIVLAFSAFSHALHVDLQCTLKAGHVAVHLYVIHTVKIIYPRIVRVPYLCVYGACLILQNHIVIGFPIFGHRRLLMLAQVNIEHFVAFLIVLNIFHSLHPSFPAAFQII